MILFYFKLFKERVQVYEFDLPLVSAQDADQMMIGLGQLN